MSALMACFRVVLVVLVVLATDLIMSTHRWDNRSRAGEPSKKQAERIRELDKLIDALANRNRQPRIVDLGADWVAIFDKSYDWREQARVVKAIQRVAEIATPEMWIRLNAHEKDSRYCVTFNDGAADVLGHFATNWTVGEICQDIGSTQVQFPVDRATEAIRVGPRTVHLPLSAVPEYPKSGESRMKVPFVELQIKLCQQAVKDLPKVASAAKESGRDVNTDPETLKQCRARLEAAIDELKKSKTGVFGKFKFPSERFELLDAKNAEEFRKQYEKAKKRGEIKDDPEEGKAPKPKK